MHNRNIRKGVVEWHLPQKDFRKDMQRPRPAMER